MRKKLYEVWRSVDIMYENGFVWAEMAFEIMGGNVITRNRPQRIYRRGSQHRAHDHVSVDSKIGANGIEMALRIP